MINNSNRFVNLFGYNSPLMRVLLEFLIDVDQDSNNSSDVLGIVFSCKIMYNTCDVYLESARFLLTRAMMFENKKRNKVRKICYDSTDHVNDQFNGFINLKRVTFGNCFNQPLKPDVLTGSLTHLTFEKYGDYDQPLKPGVLPGSLTHLAFGWKFNQLLIQGVLPESLTHLTIGEYSNQPLTQGVFHESLTLILLVVVNSAIHSEIDFDNDHIVQQNMTIM
jgi:hypothetical protein